MFSLVPDKCQIRQASGTFYRSVCQSQVAHTYQYGPVAHVSGDKKNNGPAWRPLNSNPAVSRYRTRSSPNTPDPLCRYFAGLKLPARPNAILSCSKLPKKTSAPHSGAEFGDRCSTN